MNTSKPNIKILKYAFHKHIGVWELLLLLVLCFSVYLNALSAVEFHPDETFWITTSVRLDSALKLDFEGPPWTEDLVSYEVRPVPSYLAAIGQRLAGITPQDIPSEPWDWSQSTEANTANNLMPSRQALFASRLPMVILAVSSILITTSLVAAAHSRLAGYIFFLFSLNPYFRLHLRRAMTESPLLFFTTLAFLSTYKLLTEIKKGRLSNRLYLWAFLTGLFTGLAGQSKLTGLAVGIMAITAVFVALVQDRSSSKEAISKMFLSAAFTTLSTAVISFLAVYPFFYHKILQRLVDTVYARKYVLEAQLIAYASYIILPDQRVRTLIIRVFDDPYFQTNGSLLLPSFLLGITAFGVIYTIIQIIKHREAGISLVLLLGMLFLGVPMLFTPLDWDRYFLYPVFFSGIFLAIGAAQILSILTKQAQQSNTIPPNEAAP